MPKQIKTITIAVTVLVLIGAGFLFLRSGGGDPLLQVENMEGADGAAGSTVVSLLARLRTVDFNQDIFSSPGFQSLVDYGIELEAQPVGRSNPFAPIGTDAPLEDDSAAESEPEEDAGTTTPPVDEEVSN